MDDDDDDEERGNLALFITTCVLLVLGLGAVGVLIRRSLAKGPSKPESGPGRGYEKLSNSNRYGGGGGATSFSSESYSAGGGGGFQGGSSGGRYREEQLVDLSDRSKGHGEDDDDDDEDEDIVYMGQDGTVYRKFRYGQLSEDNEDELEYDDESYSFRYQKISFLRPTNKSLKQLKNMYLFVMLQKYMEFCRCEFINFITIKYLSVLS